MNVLRPIFYTSLARRLLVSAAISSLVVLAGLVVILSTVYRAQTITILDDELDNTLLTLLRAVEVDANGNLVSIEDKLPSDPVYQTPFSGRYWAIVGLEPSGDAYSNEQFNSNSLYEDSAIPWPEDAIQRVFEQPGIIHRLNGVGPFNEPVRMAAESIELAGRDLPVMLLAVFDRTTTDAGARRFTYILIAAMSALAAAILLALWLGIRTALRPLSRVRGDIEDIREGLRTRLDDDYPSEVLPLSREMNKLIEHNRGVVERAQTHVGNLAHALKTPIAVMMNEAKGNTSLDDVVRRQAGAMHSNVQHYLKRAQAAARAQTLGARSEVAPVLADLGRLLNRLFDANGIEVEVAKPTGLYFRGERQDLEEMVGNLMENACKWATSRVSVMVEISDTSFLIHVDDDGKGLTPDERTAALQRGVRLDEAAPGTGLGLSIVTELAELHEGVFVLDDAPELGGLRATLRLPRA